MKCCVCKRKEVKYVTTVIGDYNYGFCSKVCLANNAIKHYKLKLVKK